MHVFGKGNQLLLHCVQQWQRHFLRAEVPFQFGGFDPQTR